MLDDRHLEAVAEGLWVGQGGSAYPNPVKATQPIRMHDFWNVIFSKEPGQTGLRGIAIPMPLKQYVEDEPVLIHRSPEPCRTPLTGVQT
ncbi:hypothetical protein M1R55_16250 (plasmid) [Deinococcus sp. QL22]|nr:hypothetical protein [Deinococcus sp. QL22]UQN08289.1 hypothetical protein M1R55_16250 [Deinococcus sp. QL22]